MAEQRRPRLSFKQVRPGGRDIVQLTWPSGGDFGLLLLRCSEVQDAHFAAVERFTRRGQPIDGVAFIGEFSREKELQEVFRMLLEPDTVDVKRRLFKSADIARAELDLNEVGWVMQQHQTEAARVLRERGLLDAAEEREDEDSDAD